MSGGKRTRNHRKSTAGIACVALLLAGLVTLVLVGAVPTRAQSNAAPTAQASSQVTGFASLPAAAQSAVSTAIGRDQSDYHARPTGNGGFRMLNPGTRLTAEFAKNGVVMRVGAAAGAEWRLALQDYGRGNVMAPMSSVVPQADANRVEYRRGGLTEWYVNSPLGLEQGFTLTKPPARAGDPGDQPLTIAMGLSGDLSASLDSAGSGLTLRQHDGQAVLRYTGLAAQDAAGEPLRCWLELLGSQLLLRINDAGARYPIIVDPWMQAAELTNSSGPAGDTLASSVAVDEGGDTVVVGGSLATTQGAVYVFVEPSVGGWAAMTSTPTAVLTASDGAAGDAFGLSVGINGSGNTIVVGAPFATIGSKVDQGAAYVFVEPTGVGGWVTTSTFAAKLTESDGAAGDEFGWGVGIDESGDTVVAGFFVSESSIYDKDLGAAYVFVEPTVDNVTAWSLEATTTPFGTQTAKLTASDGTKTDSFGYSVGINESGTTVVVGAPDATVKYEYQGAAYVFVEPTGGGGWATTSTFAAKLTASDGAFESYLGWSVGISESGGTDTVVTAGYQATAVYVFVEPASGVWITPTGSQTYTAELTPSGGAKLDDYGSSVGISKNTVVVGAPLATIGSVVDQGAAYVFVEPGSGWANTSTFTAELFASGGAAGNELGYGVGISGNTVVASAPGVTIAGKAGAAFVFTQTSTGPYAQYTNSCSQCNGGGPLDFGAVDVNTPGTQTVTLTNPPGSSTFNFTGVSLQQGTSFSITKVVCSTGNTFTTGFSSISETLAVGDSCTITLQFAPLVNENGYGDLLIIGTTIPNSNPLAAPNSNASAAPPGTLGQAMLLVGDGVEPIATYSPSNTSYNLGNVTVGQSATQAVTLTNTGDAALVLGGVSFGLTGHPGFTFTTSCGGGAPVFPLTMNPGASCTATVQFAPTGAGSVSVFLGFDDNAGPGESNLTSMVANPYFQEVEFTATGVAMTSSPAMVTDNETITVTDTPTFPDVSDSEPIMVTDKVKVVACGTIMISPSGTLPVAAVGTPYTQGFNATGGTIPLMWATSSAPSWLTIIVGTGVLSGTPPTGSAGTYPFTVTVTDANGCPGSANVSLTVVSVTPIATTTTIVTTSSTFQGLALPANFALVDNPVTVTFTVKPASGGATATGTTKVADGVSPSTDNCSVALAAGAGSCALTISQLGTGSTPLTAAYSPDATASALGLQASTSTPPVTEDVVAIASCGTPPSIQTAAEGTTVIFTFSTCLATTVLATPNSNGVVTGCPPNATCTATVAPVSGKLGVYSVVVTIVPGGAGKAVPQQQRRPWDQRLPFTLLGFGVLLAILMALQLAQQKQARPRLAYAAGLVLALAMLLSGLNGCANHSGSNIEVQTPPGTYVIHVTITAGKFSVVVPVTLNVTN
jgi:hypothetical protein